MIKKNYLSIYLLLCLLVFVSCESGSSEADSEPEPDSRSYDDFPEGTRPNATGAFVNSGYTWNRCSISYHIVRASNKSGIPISAELQAYRQAFQVWADASGMTIYEVFDATNADIIINHKDEDGANGVLGYAYYPCDSQPICGDIFFDDSEEWTLDYRENSRQPIDLYTVAIHEVGHSLGLGHSSINDAVMAAYYYGSKPALHQDDIAGIQALYIRCQ